MLLNRRQQLLLLQTTLKMMPAIEDGMRRAEDAVLLGQVGESDGGDGFGRDEGGLKGELVGQADRLGAVGSSGGGENFHVDRLLYSSERGLSFTR
jgi:hypothetical protein